LFALLGDGVFKMMRWAVFDALSFVFKVKALVASTKFASIISRTTATKAGVVAFSALLAFVGTWEVAARVAGDGVVGGHKVTVWRSEATPVTIVGFVPDAACGRTILAPAVGFTCNNSRKLSEWLA
jgi:hypothetical protein